MKVKEITGNFIRVIQKILIVILLTILYFIGFGITVLVMLVFDRRAIFGGKKMPDTCWDKAEGYALDLKECGHGS